MKEKLSACFTIGLNYILFSIYIFCNLLGRNLGAGFVMVNLF